MRRMVSLIREAMQDDCGGPIPLWVYVAGFALIVVLCVEGLAGYEMVSHAVDSIGQALSTVGQSAMGP